MVLINPRSIVSGRLGFSIHTGAFNDYAPDYVELIVNKSCFFKCTMCNIWNLEEPEVMELDGADYFLRLLKTLVKLPFIVFICGGETLSYKYLEGLIKKCTEYGFTSVITTNGFLLSEKLISKLTDAGLKDWVISFDSIDLQKHDFLRGVSGAGERVLYGIKMIKTVNPKANITINTVISGYNLESLPKTLEWANSNPDINIIHFNAVTEPIASGAGEKWHKLPKYSFLWPKDIVILQKTMNEIIGRKHKKNKIANSAKQLEIFIRYFKNPEDFLFENPCHMDKSISIDADGSIYMCHELGKIGNIKDRDFIKLWTGKNAKDMRNTIKSCRKNCKMLINCNYMD